MTIQKKISLKKKIERRKKKNEKGKRRKNNHLNFRFLSGWNNQKTLKGTIKEGVKKLGGTIYKILAKSENN